MAKLDFSSFSELLRDVAKVDLYDAVKPELQAYAAHRASGLPIDQAYSSILEQSYRVASDQGPVPDINDPVELVRRMGRGRDGKGMNYGTARVHVEVVYYFFLFSDEVDPTAYGERISIKLFRQSFFDEFATQLRALSIERPNYLPPPSRVKLGSVEISLGADRDLLPFRMDWHERPKLLDEEGKPVVYAAMHWRSGLSQLHGRVDEYSRLWEWALDESKFVKVMLISGPGGTGKTRLAAEVVRNLISKKGWKGGFLLDGYDKTQGVYDGNGAGAVFAIDYPEEKTEAVKEILTSAVNPVTYSKPIRIILVSRENRASWLRIFNKIELARFDETPLDLKRYVSRDDALEIVSDVEAYYPELLSRPKSDFVSVGEWLDRHETHRLPLNVVAASIHAVLDPSHAFKLDGADVLAALADWELRRVRYYSERDLGDRESLEKLLGLSLFTQIGLAKRTVFELGDTGICSGRTGESLLEAVRKTPYWLPKTNQDQSHLIRLEPDRPAAIFCLKALRLDDPSPGLPRWLIPAANQDADGFGDRLSRLAFDIGYVDPAASKVLEQQSVEMLDTEPTLIDRFQRYAYRRPSAFSATFAAEICRRLLLGHSDLATKATLLHNQSTILSDIGRRAHALESIEKAVSIRRQLALGQPDIFMSVLASSLDNHATMLASLGKREEALEASEEAIAAFRQLAQIQPDAFLPELARSLSNQTNRLASVGRREEALHAAEEAVTIRRQLVQARPEAFLPGLAMSLHNQSARLHTLGRLEEALGAIKEAIAIRRQLAQVRPDLFTPDLALSLTNQAGALSDFGQNEAALEPINEAVAIRRQLARARPDAFLAELAASLTNQAIVLAGLMRQGEALQAIEEAVAVLRQQVRARPDAILPELALALANQATYSPISGGERNLS